MQASQRTETFEQTVEGDDGGSHVSMRALEVANTKTLGKFVQVALRTMGVIQSGGG